MIITRKTLIPFLLSLLLIVVAAMPTEMSAAKTGSSGVYHPAVTMIEGSVMIMGQESSVWEPVAVGMLLLSGDVIKTGNNSQAEFQFLSGKVRLFENSVLIIPSIGVQERRKDVQEVLVEEGAAVFEINPLGIKRQFEFRTKNIQGGVKGTTFAVGYRDGNTHVVVYEGKIQIMDVERSRKSHTTMKAGDAIQVKRDSRFGHLKKFDVDKARDHLNSSDPLNYGKVFGPALDRGAVKDIRKQLSDKKSMKPEENTSLNKDKYNRTDNDEVDSERNGDHGTDDTEDAKNSDNDDDEDDKNDEEADKK